MDFEKLQKDLDKLETYGKSIADAAKKPADAFESDTKLRDSARQAMKSYAGMLKEILMDYLKSRKQAVRTGQLYRDCAKDKFVPGDLAGDNLIIKWGGNVTPSNGRDVHEEAGRFVTVSDKLIPVLRAYRKE